MTNYGTVKSIQKDANFPWAGSQFWEPVNLYLTVAGFTLEMLPCYLEFYRNPDFKSKFWPKYENSLSTWELNFI